MSSKRLIMRVAMGIIAFFSIIFFAISVMAEDGPPFVGCVDNGDWLCMCYYNGEYLHDCANYESQPKKDYIALCGDATKGEAQWRWDVSMGFTGKGDCCKGQNVCRPSPTPIPTPTQPIIPTVTKKPTPTPTPIRPVIRQKVFSPTIPSQTSFSFQIPQLTMPKFSMNITKLNQGTSKSLGIFKFLFTKIKYYDSMLENQINKTFKSILKKI